MLVSSWITAFVHGRIKITGNSTKATALGRANNSPEAPLRIEATRRNVGIAETNEGNWKQLRSSRVQQTQCERRLGTKRSRLGKTQVEFCIFHCPHWDLPSLDAYDVSNSMQGCAASCTHALEGLRVGTDREMDFPEVLRSACVCFIYGTNQH